MVLWISSSSMHCHNTTWHIAVLHPAGGIQKRQLSVFHLHPFSLDLYNLSIDAKLNYTKTNLHKNRLSFLLSCAVYVIFHIFTSKRGLKRYDTLNVFDTAIEGEFFTSSGNLLAAPILQSAVQIFLAHSPHAYKHEWRQRN